MLEIEERDPMVIFRYGFREPGTRRQYPRRFRYFLDFLKLSGALDEQAKQFVIKGKKESNVGPKNILYPL